MPFLPQAVASVAEQCTAVEHLVIDAGSADGSLEWLRQQSGLTVIERPGMPLYDAWNLGLSLAQGEWVGFVNADDWLPEGALTALANAVCTFPDVELVCGQAKALDVCGALICRYPANFSKVRLALGAPAINAMLIRRNRLAEDGGFRTAWRLAGDRERLLRLALCDHPPRVAIIDNPVYCYRVHAGSQTLWCDRRRRQAIAREHLEVARSLESHCRSLTADARLLRRWRAKEGAALTLALAASGQFGAAIAALAAAWGAAPLLPVDAFLAWRQGRRAD